VDWKKKVLKSAAGDLDVDETLLAATFLQAGGATRKMMMGGAIGGAIGAVVASKTGNKTNCDVPGSLAAGFPKPPVILGLTPRRLVAWSQNQITGRPKDLLGSISVSSVSGFDVGEGRLTRPVVLQFVDGSAVAGEAPTGAKPEEFAAALAQRRIG